MQHTFKLKKGEIKFTNEKVSIKDDAKRQKWWLSIILFCSLFYGYAAFISYLPKQELFFTGFGLFLGVLNTVVLIIWLLRSVKSEIPLKEIESLDIRQRFQNVFLDIRLRNKKVRRVAQIEELTELKEFICANYHSKR